jgi:hypothetical protein
MKNDAENIPDFKAGKRRKWPNKVEPLPTQTHPATSESQEHTQPPPETEKAPADTDPEARRIAKELVKLHRDGAIKTAGDASFYANLIRDFDATYPGPMSNTGKDLPPGPYVPTKAQRVPQPPMAFHRKRESSFFSADLVRAFAGPALAQHHETTADQI